jgi:hypothetical protein
MDTHITLSPGEIMRQIAEFMKDEYPDVSATVPKNTSWRQAIRAIESALEDRDAAITIKDTRMEARRARLRQAALENVAYWSKPRADTPLEPNILTEHDTTSIPPRAPASEKARKRLKETMIDPKDFRDPY